MAGSTSANRKLSHSQPACRTGMIKDRPPTLPPKARESRGGHSLTLAIALAWAHTEWLQLATSAMAATCSRHSWNTLFLTVCYQRNLIHVCRIIPSTNRSLLSSNSWEMHFRHAQLIQCKTETHPPALHSGYGHNHPREDKIFFCADT